MVRTRALGSSLQGPWKKKMAGHNTHRTIAPPAPDQLPVAIPVTTAYPIGRKPTMHPARYTHPGNDKTIDSRLRLNGLRPLRWHLRTSARGPSREKNLSVRSAHGTAVHFGNNRFISAIR